MRILLTNKASVPLPWTMAEAVEVCDRVGRLLKYSAWGIDVNCVSRRSGRIDAELLLVDTSDVAGALGYHWLTPDGLPYGIVAIKTTLDAGYDPMVTLTHEFLEVAGDPDALAIAEVETSGAFKGIAYELCDPVEHDRDGIDIQLASGKHFVASNFILPSWFVQGSPGPWDQRGLLKAALTLRPGGYTANYDCSRGWTQQFAKTRGRMSFRARNTTRIPRRALRTTLPSARLADVPRFRASDVPEGLAVEEVPANTPIA